MRPRLTRAALGGAGSKAAPVRIVHLGLGRFHRAHQAWYTARSEDAADWGIAAFTGRTPAAAVPLAEQDGLYTLIERADTGDRATVVPSISRAADGADVGNLLSLLAADRTAVVTLTVTEHGYHLDPQGRLDLADPAVTDDLRLLRAALRGSGTAPAAPATAPARLLLGLQRRRLSGGGPLAVVPCDNVPGNGRAVRGALTTLAEQVDPGLARWVDRTIAFVSTSVDRITPATTGADVEEAARLTGFLDLAPVVTEPFSDWVLCGEFPAGRPAWETAGAHLVDDVTPYERRKLWLLNGAHSLLAYLGILRGHGTVAEAIADPDCLGAVRELWRDAGRRLPSGLDVDSYCAALLTRFANARIAHRLEQVGMDGTAKLPVRIVPVALAERAGGREARGCATVLAAWVILAAADRLPQDARGEAVAAAVAGEPAGRTRRLLRVLSDELAADRAFVELVEGLGQDLRASTSARSGPEG